MTLVVFVKSKKRPVGSVSPSGKSKKVAEGKWIPVVSRDKLPKRVKDAVTVPPAWVNVRYASDPNARIMVMGEDNKGRTQYLYNPKHVTATAKEKFSRINSLNKVYDDLVAENVKNMKKGKTEAECLALIIDTGIRPGSEKETNAKVDAFGATTLEGRHIIVKGKKVQLDFVGKKGVPLLIPVNSPEVANMLIRRKSEVGDSGRIFPISGDRLLLYTKGLGGGAGYQSKDFRTHLGTDTAMKAMKMIEAPTTMPQYKRAVLKVAEMVAERLGNTRKVALGSYINPAIFEKWRRKIATA